MAFYYWRTTFQLDSTEKAILESNGVKTLFIRYFDLDFKPEDQEPVPIIPVIFNQKPAEFAIIPVVFIKKRVFERISKDSIPILAKKVFRLVTAINASIHMPNRGTQFDCDWTERTRGKYFSFLHAYRSLAQSPISCTIRLHQVKYPLVMGIPPVDYGSLMFYNMGEIDAGANNSVYEKAVAEKYSPSIQNYPLTMDLALPIFTWSLQIRQGKVIQLLNKMSFAHFENDSNFNKLSPTRYAARHACFHGGYYFQEGDSVKIEHVDEENLLDILDQTKRFSNHKIRGLIFYDLDIRNISLYEKGIFEKLHNRAD